MGYNRQQIIMRKKLFTFLLAMVVSISPIFAESGTCGENLTLDLTDGVLTISGTGDMFNYNSNYSPSPWYSDRSSITTIIISEGVTSIGERAFDGCSDLTSVTIPNSVTSIGYRAFSGCSGLKEVHISDLATWCKISFGSYNANPLYYAHNLYLNGSLITDLVIPNSVTSIGNYAFYNCSGLTTITIPNSVTSIGNCAFYDCSGLTSVTIPNSVTSIGYSAFYGCTGLTSVTIPNSVTKIGSDAFYDVFNIAYNGAATGSPWGAKSVNGYVDGYFVYSDATKTNLLGCLSNIEGEVTIPNTVKSIGQNAFRGCKGITSVTIPNSVTSIGKDAFSGCTGLKEVHISDLATWCKISFGSYNANPLDYAHNLYLNGSLITDLVIPNSVTSIGDYAFYGCSGLTSVTIPNSVTNIGNDAFYNVLNIAYNGTATGSPWGARSVNGYVDGYFVYSDATKTELIKCSAAIEGELVIPNTVTSIGNSAFRGCYYLTSVTIPNSVTNIGERAFSYCSGLTSVTIPNSVTSIGNYAFYNCSKLTSVTIPNSVTSIGESAFSNCSGLTSVTIPNSVTSIGSSVFGYCSGLKEVHISDLTAWCKISFGSYNANPLEYAHNLYLNGSLITDLVIPNSVTSIGNYAFYDCSGLTSVTIPNSVTSIGSSAFGYCSGLTSVTIPNSVTSIGSSAFYGCSGLTSVTISNGVTSIGSSAFYNCSGLTSVTIPNSVTSIDDYAFYGCSGLTSVTIPSSVTSIGSSAFYNVLNIAYNGTATGSPWGARSVNGYVDGYFVYSDATKTELIKCSAAIEGGADIPSGVKKIGESAFSNCSGLTSVTIPNSVTRIGYNAFSGCNGLKEVHVEDLAAWCNIYFGSSYYGYSYHSDYTNPLSQAHKLYLNAQLVTDLVIPNNVTSIRDDAFYGCSSLTSVTIPNSVTSIGEDAFSVCIGLKEVHISDIAAWCKISFGGSRILPFANAYNLYLNGSLITDLVIPNNVTSIGERAFSGCSGLTSVTFPNSVTSIGDFAFYGCSGLTSVTISNGVTRIGVYAFSDCSGLTSVTIPNSVTSIGGHAFEDCSGLTAVTIPNSVTNIDYDAFSGCTGLTSVNIPNSVTKIGSDAFYDVLNIVYSGKATGSPWGAKSVNGYVDGYFVYSDATKTNLLGCLSNIEGEVTIPNTVKSIGQNAFRGCKGITSVTIPNSVTNIGNYAFEDCSGLKEVHISDLAAWCRIGFGSIYATNPLNYAHSLYLNGALITDLVIPNNVTSIGSSAFRGCSGLTSVTIPNSVTSIGEDAFYDCSGLKEVHISDLAAWCKISFGSNDANPLYYAHDLYLNGLLITDLVIPNSVTSIGNYAFYDCSGLTSVTIPNSVTSIGSGAFYDCSGLKEVHISDMAAWCKISFGSYSANPLDYAHDLYLNGLLITDLVIPNSVTSIGSYAFYDCSGLTSVTIPNSVTSIGGSAFYGCSGLTSVTIPNSVTSIGEDAFYNCSGLTSVTIPNSVTSIGNNALYNCSGLEYVISLPNIPPTIKSYTFPTGVTIYVNNEALDSYQNATNWKDYDIKVLIDFENTEAPTSAVISMTNNAWSLNGNYIVSCGIEGGEMFSGNTLEYIGLEPNSEYTDVPIVLTSNTSENITVNLSFTTSALTLTTQPSKPVSSNTAILLAETNMADIETSCGFEYKRNDAPADMEGNKVYCPVASGQMAGRLKGLKDDVYYKYRAFYQSAAGNMFYGDWQYIFTGDVAVEFDPILYTYGATVVRENEATISGYALAGSEDFTEQGFEYWAESRTNSGANAPHRVPAALNEHFFVQASGIALRATLTNLDAGTVYKYRVYGKVGDQYYYGTEQAFTTTGTYTPPTYTVTFANWDGAVLQSSQVEDGKMPIYSGETPVRPEDEQYTYTFSGWTPQIVAATADATYTAQYVAKDKHEGLEDIQEDNIPCTKVVRDGQIFILRGEKVYSITGQEVR